jgi:uncharacterized membrane protein YciS (DUF1049 family)
MKKILIYTVFTMFLTSNTIANDGNDLLKRCTYAAADDLPKINTELLGASFCLGFIEGAVNGIQVAISVNVEKKRIGRFVYLKELPTAKKRKYWSSISMKIPNYFIKTDYI